MIKMECSECGIEINIRSIKVDLIFGNKILILCKACGYILNGLFDFSAMI